MQLSELLDEACKKSGDYFQVTDDTTQRKQYKRQNRRDNQPSASSQVVFSKETHKMLKFAVSTTCPIRLIEHQQFHASPLISAIENRVVDSKMNG